MPARRRAFSLVELLVVVGVVTLLLALLLPAAARAREQARRVVCASNLHQLAGACVAYAQAHGGRFPRGAGAERVYPGDWLVWQPGTDRRDSAVAPYLDLSDPAVLLCPSDDPSVHVQVGDAPFPYPFSYSLNDEIARHPSRGRGSSRVVPRASEVVLMVDADELRVYSGAWIPTMVGLQQWEHPIATRHDPTAHEDWSSLVLTDFANRPDRDDRGNVAFCDGHVDMVTREYTWTRKNYYPWGPVVPLNYPGPK